jgi:hypothetical protein
MAVIPAESGTTGSLLWKKRPQSCAGQLTCIKADRVNSSLDSRKSVFLIFGMEHADMSRWKWAVLIFEIALFALILVLPQVELPEFPVHDRTAPVMAKGCLRPPVTVAVSAVQGVVAPVPAQMVGRHPERDNLPRAASSHSLLSLLCAFLC